MSSSTRGGDSLSFRDCTSLMKDRYYNSEENFCRVYSEEVLIHLEQILLWNRISYFIQEENTNLLSRIFGARKHSWTVRINSNDIEYAIWLIEEMRGVEIIAGPPQHDWSPSEAKKMREEYGGREGYFARYRAQY